MLYLSGTLIVSQYHTKIVSALCEQCIMDLLMVRRANIVLTFVLRPNYNVYTKFKRCVHDVNIFVYFIVNWY